MKQRKRRLCTALLCAVLIMSNVLSAGMPVYAKSPDAGSDSMSDVYFNETVSPMTENGAAETPDASDDTDKQTREEVGDNADSGSGIDDASDDTPANGDESKSDDSNIDDDTAPEDDPVENADPDVEGSISVSDNDVNGENGLTDDTLPAISPDGDGDYLTEDPKGYDLTDITMTPGSYSAELSAVSQEYIYDTYYF